MDKKFEDTQISIGKGMTLTIKEVRGTSSMTSFKEGYDEVSKNTETRFHWELYGLASKLGPEVPVEIIHKEQELYDVAITSQGFTYPGGFGGFKSRDDAIRNAVEFAKRNGINVDGYKAKATKKQE